MATPVSDARAGALRAAFAHRVGGAPAGVWLAPGRANLIGDHTDYNEGLALPLAIDRAALAAAALRDDDRVLVGSTQRGEVVVASLAEIDDEAARARWPDWTLYALGAARVVLAAAGRQSGVSILVEGDVPEGSGLSSSAALSCAVCLAVAELTGLGAGRTELALLAQRAENEYAGVPVGVLDQMASLHGAAGTAVFLDARSLRTEPVPFHPAAAGLTLLVLDTASPRRLAAGAYADRREACKRAAAGLGVPALRDATLQLLAERGGRLDPVDRRRARHVISEDARVEAVVAALRSGRLDDVGEAMQASHRSLRDDFEVSSPALDAAVDAALAAGAVGARMTGAGFGGSAIALVPTEGVERCRRLVTDAFAARGFAMPTVFPVVASDGARRVA